MANFDDLKLSVEALSGGKNTVLFDDMEMPSIMVPFPKFNISQVITGGTAAAHPGFIVGSTQKELVYVSKFLNIVVNGRAYSLAGKDPRANITFDTAFNACRAKGDGWCLTPFSLWAAIALWCRKNGTMPRGNNNYGADHGYPMERGTPSMARDSSNRVQRTATGSGPDTWNHNWKSDGIADLNGDVTEWTAGMRLNDGEIQLIPNADIFDPEVSNAAASAAWKAIKASDGSLVAPGTAGTLKYDSTTFKLVTTLTEGTAANQSGSYTNLGLESGLTVPELAKALILYPDEPGGDYGGDYHYWNAGGERMPLCGGNWNRASYAGVFHVALSLDRSLSDGDLGFRSAFCEL